MLTGVLRSCAAVARASRQWRQSISCGEDGLESSAEKTGGTVAGGACASEGKAAPGLEKADTVLVAWPRPEAGSEFSGATICSPPTLGRFEYFPVGNPTTAEWIHTRTCPLGPNGGRDCRTRVAGTMGILKFSFASVKRKTDVFFLLERNRLRFWEKATVKNS